MADNIPSAVADSKAILSVRSVSMEYPRRSGLGGSHPAVAALRGVSLELYTGKTLALVGPSGSGKSTLAKCLVLLERPNAGEILYQGKNLLTVGNEEVREARKEIHLIFQDSASALNPRFTVEEAVSEPLVIHQIGRSAADRRPLLREVMEHVELPTSWLNRNALDLSGGQRQRVAIARALVLRPKILVLDEALSSLDLSTQGQIANLLLELQARHGLAYLFITHDVPMAGQIAEEVAVMRAGRLVQRGTARSVFTGNLQMSGEALPLDSRSRDTEPAPLIPLGN